MALTGTKTDEKFYVKGDLSYDSCNTIYLV